MLKMLIVPLVFFSITSGVCKMGDPLGNTCCTVSIFQLEESPNLHFLGSYYPLARPV
ncbi:hypothetical protein D4758_21125 [Enterocloster citroniae]|nr:hypothetical protein [Enterocloster citroniae]